MVPENAYFDGESATTMYKGAGYCICCHRPMMKKGQKCGPCSTDDPCIKGEPLIVNMADWSQWESELKRETSARRQS